MTRRAWVNPTSQDGSPIRLSVLRCQLLTVCCPPSRKIASKASVTFARSSSEITLLSDSGCILSFCAREDYVEEAWPIVDPVLKANTPV